MVKLDRSFIISCLLLFFLLTSCSTTPSSQVTVPATLALTPIPVDRVRVSPDFDGVMVLAQFYTLSAHGFYEEAYDLLSASRKKAMSLEDYVKNEKMTKPKPIHLFTIQPYYEWALREGIDVVKEPEGVKRFAVWLSTYEGEGSTAGSETDYVLSIPIVTMVLEKEKWKICSSSDVPTAFPVECK